MSLKTKILLLLSSVILGVATIVATYSILHDKDQYEARMSDIYQSVRLNYEETLHDIVRFYVSRADANMKTEGVLNAFRSKNHDALYPLIAPRWEVMRQENPMLTIMQFHNADGTSLLRMHQPEVYGDPIASQRSMVAHIHREHKTVYGFEEGRQGLAFRILTPVIEDGVYLGAVEFGIEASYITDKINRYTGYQSFFMIQENNVGVLSGISNFLQIGDMLAINVSSKLLPLIESYKNQHQILENSVINYANQTYAMKAIIVNNYLNQPIGAVIFVQAVADFSNHVFQMIIATALITLVLIFALWMIISRMYDTVAEKMSFQEAYNQTILDAIPSPVIVTDGHQLIAANKTFLAYFHYTNVAAFKREHQCVCEYFEEGDTEEYLLPMVNDQRWSEYISDHPYVHHKAKITIEGKTTIFEVKLSVLRFHQEKRYVVIFTDISSIQARSMTDPLTGVANRLHFTMVFQHTINMALRDQKSLGVIFFDIDHFKEVNDLYGHLIGDEALKHIAGLVKQRLRKSDIIARWGGEEFIILLPDSSLEETLSVGEIIRQTIELENFERVGRITCSFGVAALKNDESSEELLTRLDKLLYKAKESGRNRVVY
ncbi:MAG: diguanylate cyclase [Sulfuricurvum sp.]|uniref:diguanylate cyclase n=1 Tax=Sulfuricurvum sp. TaxID=2025608 RepID=UPI002728D27A|nr:diguanylate cyclase [Sulfuricurvum sp.]MDO9055361.1 diguanylate cyclase [Sulfuricurvum sp.]